MNAFDIEDGNIPEGPPLFFRDGQAIKCEGDENPATVYRYVINSDDNTAIRRRYPGVGIADFWDNDWRSFLTIQCDNIPEGQRMPSSAQYFNRAGTDKKCPLDNPGRLFRTNDNEPLTRLECYKRCSNTVGCDYFSLGEENVADEAWKGVCMGCTADSVLEDQTGFNSFKIETEVQLDMKCPFIEQRLFRTANNEPLTRNECYNKCIGDPSCKYFTVGEGANLPNKWKGVCMGCSEDAILTKHTGFNTYIAPPY